MAVDMGAAFVILLQLKKLHATSNYFLPRFRGALLFRNALERGRAPMEPVSRPQRLRGIRFRQASRHHRTHPGSRLEGGGALVPVVAFHLGRPDLFNHLS